MAKKDLLKIRNFSGGLSEVANDNMRDNELVYAKNTVPGERYGLARCKGTEIAYAQVTSGAKIVRIIELTAFILDEYVEQTICMSTADDVTEEWWIWDSATSSWDAIEEGDPLAQISIAPMLDYYIFGNCLYWLDGTKLQKYDGVTRSDVTVIGADDSPISSGLEDKIHAAIAVERRAQRFFYAYGDSEVIFSTVDAPYQFDESEYPILRANTQDSDRLTALHEFNDGLLIFKKGSVFYFSGLDFSLTGDTNIIRLNVTSGTIFPRSICTVENAVLYLGNDGIYKLTIPNNNTIIAAENISRYKISSRLFGEAIPSNAHAIAYNGIYYLSVYNTIDSVAAQREYRYYIDMNAFYGEFTQKSYFYAAYLNDTINLYLCSDNGYILKYDDTSNHFINTNSGIDATIPLYAKTKGYDVVGNMVQDAKIKKVFVVAKQYVEEDSNVALQCKADYADMAYTTAINISFDESLVWFNGEWVAETEAASDGTEDSYADMLVNHPSPATGEKYYCTLEGAIYIYNGASWEVYSDYEVVTPKRWGWLETVSKEIPINKKAKRFQMSLISDANEPLLIYGITVLFKKKKVKGNREGISAGTIDYDD